METELWVAQGKTVGKMASFIYPGMAPGAPMLCAEEDSPLHGWKTRS